VVMLTLLAIFSASIMLVSFSPSLAVVPSSLPPPQQVEQEGGA
jgi:hypothetical protein